MKNYAKQIGAFSAIFLWFSSFLKDFPYVLAQRSRKPGHVGTCAQAHLPCHKGREGTFLTNIRIFLTFLANIHIFLTFFKKAHFKLNILLNSSNIPDLTIQAYFG